MIAIDAGTFQSGVEDILVKPGQQIFPRSTLSSPFSYACQVIHNFVGGIYVTHQHLDHIAGLVLNSAAFTKPMKVAGAKSCIDALATHIFNGSVWPDLATPPNNSIDLIRLNHHRRKQFHPSFGPNLSIVQFPVSHAPPDCDSSVYFIKEDSLSSVILFWGDVEPDSVSSYPRNKAVWSFATGLHKNLVAIFIECSYSRCNGEPLYGHLTTDHLIDELTYYAELTKSTLEGISIVITHIKDDVSSGYRAIELSSTILQELQVLANEQQLQCTFILAEPSSSFYF